MNSMKMYQVSTLQALMLGYSRAVIPVSELLNHGNIGLGTFKDVDGEMIVLDGSCYRAMENGDVVVAEPDRGVPFSTVCVMKESTPIEFGCINSIEELKMALNNIIDSHFGLNSMHMARIDGEFDIVDARSESGYESVYFPDYMDGINAFGWHLHFISDDRAHGGHVFDIIMKSGKGQISKINSIEIKLPEGPMFDTYSLKQASEEEIKAVEQGHGTV